MDETKLRFRAATGGVLVAAILIGVTSVIVAPAPNEATIGEILFHRSAATYPVTIQNLMWILFFVGSGDVLIRFIRGRRELRQLNRNVLPEDEDVVLRASDLGDIYKSVRQDADSMTNFLQRMVARIILQFHGGRSVDQANALLNSSLELFQHEIDLKYNMLRYTVWLIPTLGFIGTVIGIALALGEAGDMPDLGQHGDLKIWLKGLTGSLALAFNTTLMALVLSAILVFLMHVAQGREESALNGAGQYCLDNLINRLYER